MSKKVVQKFRIAKILAKIQQLSMLSGRLAKKYAVGLRELPRPVHISKLNRIFAAKIPKA